MKKHGSKITLLMLIAVFCAFSFCACGDAEENDAMESTEGESPRTDVVEREKEAEAEAENDMENVTLTFTSPADGDVVESGVVKVVGKAENSPNPGKDKVYMELTTEDGKKLGEASSLVADLDEEFSADLKYELSDNMTKNDDETVNAELRVYMNGADGALAKEETIRIKVK